MAALTLRVQTATGQTTKNAPLTNAEIDNNFINLDTDIQTRVLKAGDTLTGKLTFRASSTTVASLNIPTGSAPTSPAAGDIWTSTSGVFYRVDGTTTKTIPYVDSVVLKSGDTLTGKLSFVASSASVASLNVPAGTAPTSPVNGDIWADTIGIKYQLSGVTKSLAFTDTDIIAFKNIAIENQPTVTAESAGDTLTLVAGSGITLQTNATADSITISSTGGGGGGSGPVGVDIVRDESTATAGQTVFSVTGGIGTNDKVEAYLNGVLLSPAGATPDYTVSTANGNITLATGTDAGDIFTSIVTRGAALLTQVSVAQETQSVAAYITFADRLSGLANIEVNSGLLYDPGTNTVSATNFNSTSDIALKENITPITDVFSILEQINGYEFDYIGSKQHGSGVIAQEVEKVLPHIVGNTTNGKTVSYMSLIAYLLEGIKEQNKKINNMYDLINKLMGSK